MALTVTSDELDQLWKSYNKYLHFSSSFFQNSKICVNHRPIAFLRSLRETSLHTQTSPPFHTLSISRSLCAFKVEVISAFHGSGRPALLLWYTMSFLLLLLLLFIFFFIFDICFWSWYDFNWSWFLLLLSKQCFWGFFWGNELWFWCLLMYVDQVCKVCSFSRCCWNSGFLKLIFSCHFRMLHFVLCLILFGNLAGGPLGRVFPNSWYINFLGDRL